MSEVPQEEVLTALERVLGDRVVRSLAREGGSLATVSSTSAEEVELVAKTGHATPARFTPRVPGPGPRPASRRREECSCASV